MISQSIWDLATRTKRFKPTFISKATSWTSKNLLKKISLLTFKRLMNKRCSNQLLRSSGQIFLGRKTTQTQQPPNHRSLCLSKTSLRALGWTQKATLRLAQWDYLENQISFSWMLCLKFMRAINYMSEGSANSILSISRVIRFLRNLSILPSQTIWIRSSRRAYSNFTTDFVKWMKSLKQVTSLTTWREDQDAKMIASTYVSVSTNHSLKMRSLRITTTLKTQLST